MGSGTRQGLDLPGKVGLQEESVPRDMQERQGVACFTIIWLAGHRSFLY